MHFKKKLQGFLFTSALLSSICAHGMDDGTVDTGEVLKPPAAKAAELTFSDLPADIAPTICQFLDNQSFGRLCQANKSFYQWVHGFYSAESKGLIQYLKTLPADQGVSFLLNSARCDLKAGSRLMTAFYTYVKIPEKERLFLVNADAIALNPVLWEEDFTRKITDYAPYGMCLAASYFLNPDARHLYRALVSCFRNPSLPWSPQSQVYAYLFVDPTSPEKSDFFNAPHASGASKILKDLLENAQFFESEQRKARYLRNPLKLKNLYEHRHCPEIFDVYEMPDFKAYFSKLSSNYENLLETEDLKPEELKRNLAVLQAFETTLWSEYEKEVKKRGKNAIGLSEVAFLKALAEISEGSAAIYEELAEPFFAKAEEGDSNAYKQLLSYSQGQHMKDPYSFSQRRWERGGKAAFFMGCAAKNSQEKAKYFKQAAAHYKKFLEQKADAATCADYMRCGDSYLNAGKHLANPEEKAEHLQLARTYHQEALRENRGLRKVNGHFTTEDHLVSVCLVAVSKGPLHFSKKYADDTVHNISNPSEYFEGSAAISAGKLDKQGDAAGVIDFWECSAAHFNAALNTYKDPAKPVGYFKKAVLYCEKALEKLGNLTRPSDEKNCAEMSRRAAVSCTDPEERALYGRKADAHEKKALQQLLSAIAESDHKTLAGVYYEAAHNLTDPKEKLAHLKQAIYHNEKALEIMGDAAGAEDFMNCGVCYFNATFLLATPAERVVFLQKAASYHEKGIEKWGAAATEKSYYYCAQSYFSAAENLSTPEEKAAHFQQAAHWYEKLMQTVSDRVIYYADHCGMSHLGVAQNLTDPAEKLRHFQKATGFYGNIIGQIKAGQLWNVGPQGLDEILTNIMSRYKESLRGLGENTTDPDARAAALVQVEALPNITEQIMTQVEFRSAQIFAQVKAQFPEAKSQEVSFDEDGESREEEESSEEDDSTEEEASQT